MCANNFFKDIIYCQGVNDVEAKEFGEYLRKLRKAKKLTIRQLDLYSSVSNSYISQMERGERGIPSPEILNKLSKPLGVEYEDLMLKAGYIKSKNTTNDQAKNAVLEEYNRLPPTEKKLVDDMIKALLAKRQ